MELRLFNGGSSNMYRAAIVENGVVSRVIVTSEINQIPNTIDVTGTLVSAGWLYDGTTFSEPPPPPPPPAPLYSSYTVATFIEALTRDEALNFLATMKTDPLLEMWYELAKARNGVDFNDEATRTNAAYLVQANVLTQDRLDALIG
jgi:hypothetical protein